MSLHTLTAATVRTTSARRMGLGPHQVGTDTQGVLRAAAPPLTHRCHWPGRRPMQSHVGVSPEGPWHACAPTVTAPDASRPLGASSWKWGIPALPTSGPPPRKAPRRWSWDGGGLCESRGWGGNRVRRGFSQAEGRPGCTGHGFQLPVPSGRRVHVGDGWGRQGEEGGVGRAEAETLL